MTLFPQDDLFLASILASSSSIESRPADPSAVGEPREDMAGGETGREPLTAAPGERRSDHDV